MPAAESVARPLAALPDPEQQREAWQQAVDTAPGGKVTARHVESVVNTMRGGNGHSPSINSGHSAGNLIVDDDPWKSPQGDARSSRQGIKLRCRWAYCTGGGMYTVPLDTMTCTRCGGLHVQGQVGHHLAPGEAERLEAARLAALVASGQMVAVPNVHAAEEPGEFTCPRCGQRQVKLNGGAICLNEDCKAEWETRMQYDEELQGKDMDIAERRAELKGEAVVIINRLPPEALDILAQLLADIKNNYLAKVEADAAIPGL
jgi:hypothetical protein